MSLEKIALIDIGSNSMRLEIVAIRGEDFWTVARYKDSARIASGMYPGLVITGDAIARACTALRKFRHWIAFHQAESVRCVATSAVRDAMNQKEVLDRLSEALEKPIEVLDGDKEGWYSFFGVRNGFDEEDALVFDIGGGSAEIIDVRHGKPRKILTLPLGAVRLSELFFADRSRPTAAEWKKMEMFILRSLEDTGLFDKPYPALIGVGGTTRQLARISQKIRKYPFYPNIHHYEIPARDLPKLVKRLGRRLTPELAKTFSVGPDRADILPAGLAVVSAIAALSRSPDLTFSHYGLRQGLFMEYYLAATEKPPGPVAETTLRRVVRRYGRFRDSRLLRHTLRQLLSLFLPAQVDSRRLALLSETIGALAFLPTFHLPVPNHREIWSLLLHSELPGFSQKNRLMAGLVLTLKEDGPPRNRKKTHPFLRHMGNEEKRLLKVLTALFSLAIEIVLASEETGASLMLRSQVLHIVAPLAGGSLDHLTLVRTEERDLGLGHPVPIQWFCERKEDGGRSPEGIETGDHPSID